MRFISSMDITVSPFRMNKFNLQTTKARQANYVSYKGLTKDTVCFKGYYGDGQPVKKLYWLVSGKNNVDYDYWAHDHMWQAGGKRWLNAYPNDVLKRTPTETINTIMTLTGQSQIPANVISPQIRGNNWGRYANYIEINPRAIAQYDNGRVSDGLMQTLKLMTAIPPSSDYAPNCIVLSQLYPTPWGDGTTRDTGLYCVDLHRGISKNLTSRGLDHKMGDDEQVRAFNELAHLMGFKTGFRMPISSGQIKVKGEDFSWARHEKAYIDACVWAIELGFDSIYFDSAKHIVDKDGYCGLGDVPNKMQMAYILHQIREKTGRCDLSFIGEKCYPRWDYKEMGLTAGTHWGRPEDINSVKWESNSQSGSYEYAAGPEVSNDNDTGNISFEDRLNRLNSCLFGYDSREKRVPSYMQMNDIFPLSSYTNTHDLMEHAHQMGKDGAWSECERHWDGIFRTDDAARWYTTEVYRKFEAAM